MCIAKEQSSVWSKESHIVSGSITERQESEVVTKADEEVIGLGEDSEESCENQSLKNSPFSKYLANLSVIIA